jgi:hypothetical protein
VPRRRSSRRYGFVRLAQYQQDTKYLDAERAAVLGAALKLLAVAPTIGLGIVAVWQEEHTWGEYLVDLWGWGTLGLQVEDLERLVVLRWVDWE